MSGAVTVVPDAARDVNLTPAQRQEIIVRANGLPEYSAPRETGEASTREQQAARAVIEQSRYIGRCRDKDGLVTAEQFATADARCGGKLLKGYQIPAGARFEPQELFEMTDISSKVGVPKDLYYKFVVELAKRLAVATR
jgi:hypothetical protein